VDPDPYHVTDPQHWLLYNENVIQQIPVAGEAVSLLLYEHFFLET
jgi:hypothetical protein